MSVVLCTTGGDGGREKEGRQSTEGSPAMFKLRKGLLWSTGNSSAGAEGDRVSNELVSPFDHEATPGDGFMSGLLDPPGASQGSM